MGAGNQRAVSSGAWRSAVRWPDRAQFGDSLHPRGPAAHFLQNSLSFASYCRGAEKHKKQVSRRPCRVAPCRRRVGWPFCSVTAIRSDRTAAACVRLGKLRIDGVLPRPFRFTFQAMAGRNVAQRRKGGAHGEAGGAKCRQWKRCPVGEQSCIKLVPPSGARLCV